MKAAGVTDPVFSDAVDADVVKRSAASKPERLLSIDVLRGLTVAFMIVVNDQIPPAPFSQLTHAAWNGLTATDLVFPTFLFLVGLTTVLSTASRVARGARRKELFVHALRRAALLIALGFVVNNFPYFHLSTARYYGVLPRIAICYFVVASLFLLSRGWKDKALVAAGCLAGYWVLMRFVPVPGFGMPTHDVAMNHMDGNLAAWLDRQIFSPRHLYEGTRDPEGLLSTVPAVGTALFGMLAGLWLRSVKPAVRKAQGLAIAGGLAVVLGAGWNPWFPVNKKLWTSSYALVAGGVSLLLLAAAMMAVDVWRVGRGRQEKDDPANAGHPWLYRPLLVLGTNAILAYMVSELISPLLRTVAVGRDATLQATLNRAFQSVTPSPELNSLLYSLVYLLACWLLVWPLYRKRIFLRI